MSKKQRSAFWVVSTHVLTTGLAFPTIAALAAAAMIRYGDVRDSRSDLSIRAACAVLGYVIGTYCSHSYLRGAAEHEHWTACTRPAIICFAFLAVIGFAWNVTQLQDRNAFSIGVLTICYFLIIVAFGWITATGFAQLSHEITQTDDMQKSHGTGEPTVTWAARFPRLLGGCVGLAAGAVIGLGMAIYFDRGGWAPQNGWHTRLVTAIVVGGIGALLGVISGPARR
jgi:hypothetical protein